MRNIVLITIDDLRFDHCSFAGYKRRTTPTLDKMANDGLCFKNAIAPSTNTPNSMKAIFTGRHFSVATGWGRINLNVRDKMISEINREKTLAEILSEKRYSTGAFTPTAYASSYFGFDKGFDHFQDFIFKSRDSGLSSLYRKVFQRFNTGGQIAFILRSFLDFVQRKGAFMHWEKYYGSIIDWVKNVEEPFFLWCFPLDTHTPYLAPRAFRKYSNCLDMYLYNFYYNWKITKAGGGRLNFPEKTREKLINMYDDSIFYADSFVKRLWENLKHLDPIFIIHADHGEGFGEHGCYQHPPCLYEEFIHVPLIVYNGGLKHEIKRPVSLLGLASTILELLGQKKPFPVKSLLHNSKDVVISQTYNGGRKIALRMKDWKFITGQQEKDELYYLKEDHCEQKNVIEDYPKFAEKMRQIVRNYLGNREETEKIRDKVSKIKSRRNF